jgi:hypothetical protein
LDVFPVTQNLSWRLLGGPLSEAFDAEADDSLAECVGDALWIRCIPQYGGLKSGSPGRSGAFAAARSQAKAANK